MTNDRLELIANTLMEPNNMRQFGIVLKTTAKGQAAKGSGPTFKSFQNFINQKNHPVLSGCQIGEDALKSWIKQIQHLASEEGKRREALGERGRNGAEDGPEHVLRHVDASYELMEFFKEFDKKLQKEHGNRWNAKPEGCEGIEQVKDAGAAIPTGEDSQSEAMNVVKDRRANVKRKLLEEGMSEEAASKAAGRAVIRPKPAAPEPTFGNDVLTETVTKFLAADTMATSQQALKTYQDTRLAKLEEIKLLNNIVATASSQAVKDMMEQQLLEAVEQLNKMKPPQTSEQGPQHAAEAASDIVLISPQADSSSRVSPQANSSSQVSPQAGAHQTGAQQPLPSSQGGSPAAGGTGRDCHYSLVTVAGGGSDAGFDVYTSPLNAARLATRAVCLASCSGPPTSTTRPCSSAPHLPGPRGSLCLHAQLRTVCFNVVAQRYRASAARAAPQRPAPRRLGASAALAARSRFRSEPCPRILRLRSKHGDEERK